MCDTPQRKLGGSLAGSEGTRNKFVSSVSTNDSNESSVESLILKGFSNCFIVVKRKEKESCIISETDAESNLSANLEYAINMSYSILEHQSFDYQNDMECLAQSALKNTNIKQINEKIIKNKRIFENNNADVPSKRKSISPARNQSIDLFDSEYNFNEELATSMKSQNNFIDEVSESNGSPKNFIITPRNLSQTSSILGDEFLLDDDSSWQARNYTAAGNSIEDSAYSTLYIIDQFNCNTTVEAGSTIDNKCVLDTEHYKLQSCKKKTTTYEKQEVSRLTNEMLAFNDCPKSFIITQEDISQMSHVHNDENSKFEIINSCDKRMSDIISEISENDDTPVITEFISSEDDAAVPYEEAELGKLIFF